MRSEPAGGIGWLLTVEPIGDAVAWSLLRATDGGTDVIAADRIADTRDLQEHARRLQPSVSAAPDHLGHAGLWASSLTRPDEEADTANVLGQGLLPQALRSGLLRAAVESRPDTVTIACRGWLAGIPWDLLSLDGTTGPRLLERALVYGGLSPTLGAGRSRFSPARNRSSPGLTVIDPGPVLGMPRQLYPTGHPRSLTDQCILSGDMVSPSDRGLTADELAYSLHQNPSRFLYLGHIQSGQPGAPADAALMLSERNSAFALTARLWLATPDRWPAPPRVALIGCSSDDTGFHEQSGLVVAALNAGAHLITSTRWPLPVDHVAPSPPLPNNPIHHDGLTRLAALVHRAHQAAGPLAVLRDWQLEQLQAWRHGGQLAQSPLLWGGLVTYLAPTPTPRE